MLPAEFPRNPYTPDAFNALLRRHLFLVPKDLRYSLKYYPTPKYLYRTLVFPNHGNFVGTYHNVLYLTDGSKSSMIIPHSTLFFPTAVYVGRSYFL